ncbi:hypothetical protein B0J14DRAFT_87217 [Halenospora varia]|nr:hypothetical protein B0J14DRAFT_87217 [Halenospora varia]
MSDPISSTAELSDITEFAAWELEHNQRLLSEREISLLDGRIDSDTGRMVRDSSNDARSSDSEAQRETLNRGFEVPSSTQDPKPQKANSGLRKREKKARKMGKNTGGDEEVTFSQKSTQDASQESQESQIHPPSSQPRPPPSIDESAEEDDPLADFDLNEEDSQFFRELLAVAPEEEISQLRGESQVAAQQEMIDQGGVIQAALGKVAAIAGELSQQLASSMEDLNYNPIIHSGKKRKRTGPELEGSRDWYAGDGKMGVEVDAAKPVVGEKKVKKVKVLSEEELEKKRVYEEKKAARKAKKSTDTNGIEVTEPAEAISKPKKSKVKKKKDKAEAISEEAPSVADSRSEKLTGAAKRKQKRLAALKKKAALGPTKSGYFAADENVKAGTPKTGERREKKLAKRAMVDAEKASSPAANGVDASEISQRGLPANLEPQATSAEVAVAEKEFQKQRKEQERLAKALDRTRKEAEKAGLPQSVIDSLIQSKIALESAKAGPIVQQVLQEAVPREEKKKAEKNEARKAEAEKKSAKKEKRKRKRERNHNKAPEGDKMDVDAITPAAETPAAVQEDVETVEDVPELATKPKAKKVKKSRMEIVADEIALAKAAEVTSNKADGEPAAEVEPLKKRRDRGKRAKAQTDETTTEAEPAAEAEVSNVQDPAPDVNDGQDAPEATAKKPKRRDRGRKSLDNQNAAADASDQPITSEPLAELPDTNSKKPKAGRRNRSEKKKAVADDAMDVDNEAPVEGSKVHHS